jgi:mobilome CxxCx(11)CxxC protein
MQIVVGREIHMTESYTLGMQCWDSAIHNFGTAYVFECRARRLRAMLRKLTFLGIIVPVFVGGIVTTYGTQFKYIGWVLSLAGILGLIQLVASIWALIAKWDDEYAYAQESTSSNYDLSNRFKTLAQNPPSTIAEFKTKLEFLNAENQRRSDLDYRQAITDAEKRKGLRAALRSFERACTACKKVPTSMEPSECDVCGKF